MQRTSCCHYLNNWIWYPSRRSAGEDPHSTVPLAPARSWQLDVILIPRCLISAVTSAGPLRRLATELQTIPSRYHRDHIPVHVRLQYSLESVLGISTHMQSALRHGFADQPIKWNREALMEALRRGTHRAEFLTDVENRLNREAAQHQQIRREEQTPKHEWAYILQVMAQEAQKYFTSSVEPEAGYKHRADQALQLLEQRRQLRVQLAALAECNGDMGLSCMDCGCRQAEHRHNPCQNAQEGEGGLAAEGIALRG
eukprot:56382-Pyramimonas_sp.AAC.1